MQKIIKMIKRSTAYFYILLTSFILLAHAVVPHHHHGSEIFIINSDCQADKGVHKHGATEHNHEKGAQNCVIQQIVVVRSNQVSHELKNTDSSDNNEQIEGFQTRSFKNGLNVQFLKIFSNVQVPSSYLIYLRSGIGLRAPPSIV